MMLLVHIYPCNKDPLIVLIFENTKHIVQFLERSVDVVVVTWLQERCLEHFAPLHQFKALQPVPLLERELTGADVAGGVTITSYGGG